MAHASENPKAEPQMDIVIVVLGFAGARPQHMEKYVKIWKDRGYDTLCFTAENVENESMLLKTRRNAEELIPQLKEVLSTRDIALHVISMNGIWTLCSIDINHPELKLFERTRGILYDSAPIDLGFASLGKYFDVWTVYHADELKNASFKQKSLLYLDAYSEISRLAALYSKLAVRRSIGLSVKEWSAFDYLLGHPHKPKIQFFVFSETDIICHFASTLDFAREQYKAGSIVRLLHLLGSPHVSHMRVYNKEYTTFVDRFLETLRTKPKL